MRAKSGLLLYGANGYTGKLILDVALREGLRPVLAGRRADAVEPIAKAHSLPSLCFALDDPATVSQLLEPFSALLLAAGPFSRTSAPALEACLRSKTAYLDITGEVDVFESAFARDTGREEGGNRGSSRNRLRRRAFGLPREGPVRGAARCHVAHPRVSRLQGERGHDEDDGREHSEGRARARGAEGS